ncbi:DUF1707 domain-containing protein [Luteococcus sp. H138]|uniref:DUF1707 SHOCT-like domain-containing protein n=1 Tax=unclassified Luteococcus TaxID=2639923 RepID=UPI00313B9997
MDELMPRPYRIGDEERDRAVGQLREHHAAGRLDVAEFEERMSVALAAKTNTQLTPLFEDLPPLQGQPPLLQPSATTSGQVTSARNGGWNWRQSISGAAFPLALIICFVTGWQYWWIMLVPMMVSAALLGSDDDEDDEALGHDEHKSLPKGS